MCQSEWWWEGLGLCRLLAFENCCYVLDFGYHIAIIERCAHGSHSDASNPHRIYYLSFLPPIV